MWIRWIQIRIGIRNTFYIYHPTHLLLVIMTHTMRKFTSIQMRPDKCSSIPSSVSGLIWKYQIKRKKIVVRWADASIVFPISVKFISPLQEVLLLENRNPVYYVT
jgi:hypothetical protein